MKKIIAITKVKNESDIIESLCRYYAEFCDAILLYENDSIDNTRMIVQKLIDEGLPIYFTDDIKENIKKGIVKSPRTVMLQKAFDEFGADIVLNFDGDEFLSSTDGCNPREILENLDETVEYRVTWRGYVYQGEPEDTETFLPHRFQYYRNPKLDYLTKAIMSRYLFKEKQAKPGVANHFLIYPVVSTDMENNQTDFGHLYHRIPVQQKVVEVKVSDELILAHYAFRSKAQLMSKMIPSWIRELRNADRESANYGGESIFNLIKEHGEITKETVEKYSLLYFGQRFEDAERTVRELNDEILINGPLPTGFCKGDLRLKYTDYKDTEKTWLKELLTQIEEVLTTLPYREAEAVFLMRETRRHNQELIRHLKQREDEVKYRDDLIKQWDYEIKHRDEIIKNMDEIIRQREDEVKYRDDLIKQKDNEINDIYSSRSYKIARLFHKVFRLVISARKNKELKKT